MHHFLGHSPPAATWHGLPKLAGGSYRIASIPASPELRAFTRELADRAVLIRDGLVDPETDNMLVITLEGRLAALCNGPVKREVGQMSQDSASLDFNSKAHIWPTSRQTKVDLLVEKVWSHYCESDRNRGTQLIFCDLLVPQPNTDGVYGMIRSRLETKGIPASEVEFAQAHKTPKRRAALHRAIRSGEVRVCIGSTALIGLGVNVQDRAVAVHHLDAPWRPDELEQRTLRVQRPGNGHAEVSAWIYVTEGSYDPVVWQIVEQKARWASQIRAGVSSRVSEDDFGAVVLTAALAKAVATGDERLLQKARLEGELRLLEARRASWESSRSAFNRDATQLPQEVERMTSRAALLELVGPVGALHWRDLNWGIAASAREAEAFLRAAVALGGDSLVACAGTLDILAGRGSIRILSAGQELARIDGFSLASPAEALTRTLAGFEQEVRALRQQIARAQARLEAAQRALSESWGGASETGRALSEYEELCAAGGFEDRLLFRL